MVEGRDPCQSSASIRRSAFSPSFLAMTSKSKKAESATQLPAEDSLFLQKGNLIEILLIPDPIEPNLRQRLLRENLIRSQPNYHSTNQNLRDENPPFTKKSMGRLKSRNILLEEPSTKTKNQRKHGDKTEIIEGNFSRN